MKTHAFTGSMTDLKTKLSSNQNGRKHYIGMYFLTYILPNLYSLPQGKYDTMSLHVQTYKFPEQYTTFFAMYTV